MFGHLGCRHDYVIQVLGPLVVMSVTQGGSQFLALPHPVSFDVCTPLGRNPDQLAGCSLAACHACYGPPCPAGAMASVGELPVYNKLLAGDYRMTTLSPYLHRCPDMEDEGEEWEDRTVDLDTISFDYPVKISLVSVMESKPR